VLCTAESIGTDKQSSPDDFSEAVSTMHGVLLVDKPEGITSNDVVRLIKWCVRPSKVGHSGTLDPAASGLLVILIGAGTRLLDYLDESRKRYRLTIRLGEETDTGDREGTVTRTADPSGITAERIEEVALQYHGVIDQVPPHFSAIKRGGVPLYKLARKGVFPDLPPRKVEIHSLALLKWEPPFADLDLVCSRGTYARSLARDMGRDLDVGARLEALRRTESGAFSVADAIRVEEIEARGAAAVSEHLIPMERALSHIPDLQVTVQEARKLMMGTGIAVSRARLPLSGPYQNQPGRVFKVTSGNSGLLILVRPEPKGTEVLIRPLKVFKTWSDD
jgi:tRNA pseudouridine55 synthase